MIYDAILLPTKLPGWWPAGASGTAEVGSELRLEFPGYTTQVWEPIELLESKVVHLRCKEGDGPWIGSEMRFELDDVESQVYVTLEHSQIDPESDAFLYFNTKWPIYPLSLKDLLETGTGRPFPNDIRINHD